MTNKEELKPCASFGGTENFVPTYATVGGGGLIYTYRCFLCNNEFQTKEVNYKKAVETHFQAACMKCDSYAGYRKGGKLYKERLRLQKIFAEQGMKP